MAITTPSDIIISSASQLWLPSMAQEPLKTALENANYLMRWHQPPLASVCFTAENALTRSSIYIVPVMPSADALRYSLEHRLVCTNASQSVTVTVDETATYAGAGTSWSNIYSQAVTTSSTAGGLTTHTKSNQPIAATTTALRVTYTAPAAGSRNDHHVLVYPSPSAPSAGIQPSGAVPFDDGLITHGDEAAIHTEWINRCKTTAVAILTDRKQNALSFCQDETNQLHQWNSKGTDFYPLPPGRVWFPNQGPTVTLDLRVLGKVDGGANTDLLRVRQVGVPGAKTVTFNADETIKSGTLEVKLQGSGLMTYADLELAVKRTTGNKTRLMSAMAFWTPGD